MENTAKLLGGSRQEYFIGAGPHVPPSGFAFYGITIRVSGTTIASLNEKRSKDKAATTVTNKSWQGKTDLEPGEFILFEYPVTSITLTNAGDSIMAHCIPYLATI